MPTLKELEAVFVGQYKPSGSFHEQGEVMAGAQGLLFTCPRPECSHSIIVWFANSGVPPEASPKPRWTATGTGLHDLTLQPSINLDVPYVDEKGVRHESSCKWHGFVTGGSAQ